LPLLHPAPTSTFEPAQANLNGAHRVLSWEPLVRFPTAIRYSLLGHKIYFADEEKRRLG
jgi:hypothetical protein